MDSHHQEQTWSIVGTLALAVVLVFL